MPRPKYARTHAAEHALNAREQRAAKLAEKRAARAAAVTKPSGFMLHRVRQIVEAREALGLPDALGGIRDTLRGRYPLAEIDAAFHQVLDERGRTYTPPPTMREW